MDSASLTFEYSLPKSGLASGRAAKIVDEELRAATEAGLVLLRSAVVPGTPVGVSGMLRQGWQTNVTGEGVNVTGRLFNTLGYAPPVEGGSKPHFPPRGPIELWVRRKLDVSEKEVRGVAFVIARAISRRGTKAVQMAKKGLEASRGAISARFDAALARIRARLEGPA